MESTPVPVKTLKDFPLLTDITDRAQGGPQGPHSTLQSKLYSSLLTRSSQGLDSTNIDHSKRDNSTEIAKFIASLITGFPEAEDLVNKVLKLLNLHFVASKSGNKHNG